MHPAIALVSLLLSFLASRLSFFAPTKITRATVHLDTFNLRRWLNTRQDTLEPEIVLDLEFTLLEASGGIESGIELSFTKEIEAELKELVQLPRHLRLSMEGEYIRLSQNVPEPFSLKRPMPLMARPSEQVVTKLDELSERIEQGRFMIVWSSATGRKFTFRQTQRRWQLWMK